MGRHNTAARMDCCDDNSAAINFEEVTETPPLIIRNVHPVIVDYSNEYSSQQLRT